jgi:hypothetical protein
VHQRVERFLESGVRSLSMLGVPARTAIRSGPTAREIWAEAREGAYDLIVLGAPLVTSGERISLDGVVGQTLSKLEDCALLIVRSHHGWRGYTSRGERR